MVFILLFFLFVCFYKYLLFLLSFSTKSTAIKENFIVSKIS